MRRFERQFEAAVSAVFGRLAKDLLRGANAGNVEQVTAQRLRDPQYWQPLQDVIIAELRKVAEAGASFGQEQIEALVFGTVKQVEALDIGAVDWTLANDAAATWAESLGTQLAGDLAKVTTPRIQALIGTWIRDGRPFQDLIQNIQSGYFYSESRARSIAVTEVTRAYAEGNMAAWRESRVIQARRWNTATDEIVCPICRPLNGQIKPLGEPFGPGTDNPPAHVRCRCWITPEVVRE